jgi:hypothetical protein
MCACVWWCVGVGAKGGRGWGVGVDNATECRLMTNAGRHAQPRKSPAAASVQEEGSAARTSNSRSSAGAHVGKL